MRRSSKVAATVLVGLAVACPVGYAVGSDSPDGVENSAAQATDMDGIYAGVPEKFSDAQIQMCEEAVKRDSNSECAQRLEIVKLKNEGIVKPGLYTKDEFQAYFDTPLP